jgi:hypothetical protein
MEFSLKHWRNTQDSFTKIIIFNVEGVFKASGSAMKSRLAPT